MWGGKGWNDHPYFTDEENEDQNSDLGKVT